jgi:hypothetical protein
MKNTLSGGTLSDQQHNETIYHFVNEKKLINILKKNEIKPRWKHYIESENRLVTGTSFTWEIDHSTVTNVEYPIKLIFNREKLEKAYKSFLINSQRTYLQTMAIVKPDLYDPTAYKFEEETPTELFVEGVVKPLSDYLIDIELVKPVSEEASLLIKEYKEKI